MDEKKKDRLEDLTAWFLLIGIIAFSVFRTTQTNAELEKAQEDIETSSACTQQALGQVVVFADENSKYTTLQAEANADLQRVQLSFIGAIVSEDPVKQAEADQRLQDYFLALQEYNRIVELRKDTAEEFPPPSVEDYVACLDGKVEPPQDPPKPSKTP